MKLELLSQAGFDVEAVNHAVAILKSDFPEALGELCDILSAFRIVDQELILGGGGESRITQRLRRSLENSNWVMRNIEIKKIVDGLERSSTSHAIDHVRTTEQGSVALEIEWNNKDPFFDRDLENFQRLHSEGAVSVGIVVTRGQSLQSDLVEIVTEWAVAMEIRSFADLEEQGLNPTPRQRRMLQAPDGDEFSEEWARRFVQDKFGAATTHWTKLSQRIQRGVGNPCPLLLIGIPVSVIRRANQED